MLFPKTNVIAILGQIGHSPLKSRGQNFLIDGDVLERILAMARPNSGDNVVEIGTGLGILTERILKENAELYAVEIDEKLFRYLKDSLDGRYGERFHFFLGDAVDLPLANLPVERQGNFKIIANLPYAISSVWMDRILRGPLPTSMTLLLQRETADRFCAKIGEEKGGAISVRLQSAFEIRSQHGVPAACFFPAPKVESMVVHLIRRERPFFFGEKSSKFLKYFFNFRRKQLQNLCKSYSDERSKTILDQWFGQLMDQRLSFKIRSEEISMENWQRLEMLCRQSVQSPEK